MYNPYNPLFFTIEVIVEATIPVLLLFLCWRHLKNQRQEKIARAERRKHMSPEDAAADLEAEKAEEEEEEAQMQIW